MRLAVDVPGQVLGRPAELQQHLLEVPALGRMHDDRVVVDTRPDHRLDPLGPQHLLEHRAISRDEHQAVGRVLLEPEPPVPRHRLGDIDEQRVRDGVARVLEQDVDDLLGVVAGGPCVPQRQRRHPVGVHVLRCALELRERRDRPSARSAVGMVDLEQQRAVGLDDERAVGHRSPWGGARVQCVNRARHQGLPASRSRRPARGGYELNAAMIAMTIALAVSRPSGA